MTPRQHRTDVGRHQIPPEHTPRLRLKPKAPQTGYVDGAWWPRSDDLTQSFQIYSRCSRCGLGPLTACCTSSATGRKHLPSSPPADERYEPTDSNSVRMTDARGEP